MAALAGADSAAEDERIDAALAREIGAGVVRAERDLCVRLLPRVRAWGLKHLRDESLALDLAQDVLLVVLEALREGRVEQVDRLGPFVLGVCRNTALARARGERRRSSLLERFGPDFAGVVEIADERPDERRLRDCFDRLALRARAVLALTFFAERSGDEIAGELGTSAENVRVLRHRALKQLHACMMGEP
jgi:RNA polymerase sigma-70 factor (ECF subfamily)